MTDELNPVRCGCGGEAQVMHPSYTHCIVVMCGKCGIKTPYMNTETEAIETWNRAMGATDMNVGDKERTAKAEWSEPDGCYLCGGCGRQVEQIDSYCAECGVKLDWSDDE